MTPIIQPSPVPKTNRPNQSTVIWGNDVETDDFVKVPRTVLWIGRYYNNASDATKQIQPRHLILLLALAAHQYQGKPIRRYWEELGKDLGARPGTVRKWAYELKKAGLLRIKQHRGREKKDPPGYRNERNTFNIEPFIELVKQLHKKRTEERQKKKTKSETGGAE